MALSPQSELPIELEKLFVVLEHRMPTKQQLEEIARSIATGEDELPGDQQLAKVLDSASGLTRLEAENAFSLSIVRDGQIKPDTIQELKSQTLKKSGLLTLHESETGFEQLGGLEAVKNFCSRALGSTSRCAKPRGILMLACRAPAKVRLPERGQRGRPPDTRHGYRQTNGRTGWPNGVQRAACVGDCGRDGAGDPVHR